MKTLVTFLLCWLAFGCQYDDAGVPGEPEIDAGAYDARVDASTVDAQPDAAPDAALTMPLAWDGFHSILWTVIETDCPPSVPFLRNQSEAQISNSTGPSGTIVFKGQGAEAIITTIAQESPYAARIGLLAYGSIGVGDAFAVLQLDDYHWRGVQHTGITLPGNGHCDIFFQLDGISANADHLAPDGWFECLESCNGLGVSVFSNPGGGGPITCTCQLAPGSVLP